MVPVSYTHLSILSVSVRMFEYITEDKKTGAMRTKIFLRTVIWNEIGKSAKNKLRYNQHQEKNYKKHSFKIQSM